MFSPLLKKFNKSLKKNIKIAQKALIYAQPEEDIPGDTGRVFEEAIAYLLRAPELLFRADTLNKIILIGDASIPVSDDSDHVYISCIDNRIMPLFRLKMSAQYIPFNNNALQDSQELIKVYSKPAKEDRDLSIKSEHLVAAWKSTSYARKTLYRGSTNEKYEESKRLKTLREEAKSIINKKTNALCNAFFPSNAEMKEYFEFALELMLTKKSAVGNCGELSKQAYHYGKYKYPHLGSERYHIGEAVYGNRKLSGDHAFVVIGGPTYAAFKLSDWNKNVVFSDPWRNQTYSVFDYSKPSYMDYGMPKPLDIMCALLLTKTQSYEKIYIASPDIISQCNRALKENINFLITHLSKMDEPNILSLLEKNAYLSQFPSFVKEAQRFINDSPAFNIVAYLQEVAVFFEAIIQFNKQLDLNNILNSDTYGPVDTGLGSVSKEMKILLESNVRPEVLTAYKNILFYSRLAARDTLKNGDHISEAIDKVEKILSEEAASDHVIAKNYNNVNKIVNYFEFAENFTPPEKYHLIDFFKKGSTPNLAYLLKNGHFTFKECIPFLFLEVIYPQINQFLYLPQVMKELTEKMVAGEFEANLIAYEKIVRDILVKELTRIKDQFYINRKWLLNHPELIRLEQFHSLEDGLEPFSIFISKIVPLFNNKALEKCNLYLTNLLEIPLIDKLIKHNLLENTDIFYILEHDKVNIIKNLNNSTFDLLNKKILSLREIVNMNQGQLFLLSKITSHLDSDKISPSSNTCFSDDNCLRSMLFPARLSLLAHENCISYQTIFQMSKDKLNALLNILTYETVYISIYTGDLAWEIAIDLPEEYLENIDSYLESFLVIEFLANMGLKDQLKFWEINSDQFNMLKRIPDLKLLLSENLMTIKQILNFTPLQQKAFREIKQLALHISKGTISLDEVLSYSEQDIARLKKTGIQNRNNFFVNKDKGEQPDINPVTIKLQ